MSAIAAAGDHDFVAVKPWVLLDPIQERVNVFIGFVAMHAIIELKEGLTVTCGPANIWQEHGNAKLGHVVVAPSQEARARLPFRPAMDVDDHRTLAGKFGGIGTVEESGQSFTVKGLPPDELRLSKSRSVLSASFAEGPAFDLGSLGIERINIRGGPRGVEHEPQITAVVVKPHCANQPCRKATHRMIFT